MPLKTAALWRTLLWVSLWHTLRSAPFLGAPPWRALLWVIRWHTLGAVPFKIAPPWWALLWVILWQTLRPLPFKIAPPWCASQFQSHWNTFWREYCWTCLWQSSPFLQGMAGNDPGRIECLSKWAQRTVRRQMGTPNEKHFLQREQTQPVHPGNLTARLPLKRDRASKWKLSSDHHFSVDKLAVKFPGASPTNKKTILNPWLTDPWDWY